MKKNTMQNKVLNATKWASITELLTKIGSPITNMVLARILVPEAFGIVATITMIISFSEMFADAGFQKYLIQHEFKDEDEKHRSANVAFWTNFAISIFLWAIIVLFRERIATLLGNPGLGNVIAIACFQLLLTSFSSMQIALYRRDFDFKTLFVARVISSLIPFVVTIPLALLGLGFWSLIIGSMVIHAFNAIILTVKSKWKPELYYRFSILKEMLSFTIWSLIEAISIWLTVWVDAFIIGMVLDQYYLGLYRTSKTMVNALMALITASIVPVLFSALSRLQNDTDKFNKMFFRAQRFVSVVVFPIGVGLYMFSDFATEIILGSQWAEASGVIGIWALTSSISIVIGHLSSEVYRAKGKPRLSFLAQTLHLIFLIPAIIVSSRYGFWTLVYVRSLTRMQLVLIHLVLMKFVMGIRVTDMIKNILPASIAAITMGILGYTLQNINGYFLWNLFSILVCALCYCGVLFLFPNLRMEIFEIIKRLLPNRFRKRYDFSA